MYHAHIPFLCSPLCSFLSLCHILCFSFLCTICTTSTDAAFVPYHHASLFFEILQDDIQCVLRKTTWIFYQVFIAGYFWLFVQYIFGPRLEILSCLPALKSQGSLKTYPVGVSPFLLLYVCFGIALWIPEIPSLCFFCEKNSWDLLA